jgi:hypothetical protein
MVRSPALGLGADEVEGAGEVACFVPVGITNVPVPVGVGQGLELPGDRERPAVEVDVVPVSPRHSPCRMPWRSAGPTLSVGDVEGCGEELLASSTGIAVRVEIASLGARVARTRPGR